MSDAYSPEGAAGSHGGGESSRISGSSPVRPHHPDLETWAAADGLVEALIAHDTAQVVAGLNADRDERLQRGLPVGPEWDAEEAVHAVHPTRVCGTHVDSDPPCCVCGWPETHAEPAVEVVGILAEPVRSDTAGYAHGPRVITEIHPEQIVPMPEVPPEPLVHLRPGLGAAAARTGAERVAQRWFRPR